MVEHQWLLKHSGTSLRDLLVTVQIDEERKTVELISNGFDSVQIAGLVIKVLPGYGINAVLDESNYDDVKKPTWRLLYRLAGVRFTCTVTVINDYSIKDGRAYDDPLKSYSKQTTVRLCEIDDQQ